MRDATGDGRLDLVVSMLNESPGDPVAVLVNRG